MFAVGAMVYFSGNHTHLLRQMKLPLEASLVVLFYSFIMDQQLLELSYLQQLGKD